MVRPLPAFLAVILLLSVPAIALAGQAPAAAGGGASSAVSPSGPSPAAHADRSASPATIGVAAQQSPSPNTTSLLLLDDVRASNLTQPEPNLATALSMQGSELDGEFTETAFRQRLQALETTRAKQAYLSNVTADLRDEVDALLVAEERARRQYNRGEVSADAYVRELSRLFERAESLSATFEAVSAAQERSAPSLAFRSRVGKLEADLAIFRGPVLERVSAATSVETAPFDLYVQTGESGTVLAMMDGDRYVREAYRMDNVDPDARTITLAVAEAQMGEMYPWLRSLPAIVHSPQVTGLKNGVWWFRDQHPHGQLSTYFYPNTTGPYREVQYKSLPDYPFESSEETFTADIVLTVNRTYVGGPMEIRLTNQTGTPVDGEVRINGSTVGRTGDDGTVWVLQPKDSFSVTGLVDGERISMEIEPAPGTVEAGGGESVGAGDV